MTISLRERSISKVAMNGARAEGLFVSAFDIFSVARICKNMMMGEVLHSFL